MSEDTPTEVQPTRVEATVTSNAAEEIEHDPTNPGCDKVMYEGGICTCEYSDTDEYMGYGADDTEASSYDGRTHGPAMDW